LISSFIQFTAFAKVTRINNSEYEVKLVDTAGQDEYSIFPAQYSMDFHGYVLVYSITSQKSFEVIKIIYEKLIDMMGKAYVPIVLVGNKTDLHQERAVSFEEGKKCAESWKATFLETSAKQNEVGSYSSSSSSSSSCSLFSPITHFFLFSLLVRRRYFPSTLDAH